MEYKLFADVLYEVTVLSLSHGDETSVQLTDMSPNGGSLAEVLVSPRRITLLRQSSMPLDVFEWWTENVIDVIRNVRLGEDQS